MEIIPNPGISVLLVTQDVKPDGHFKTKGTFKWYGMTDFPWKSDSDKGLG